MSRCHSFLQRLFLYSFLILAFCTSIFSFKPAPQPGLPVIRLEGEPNLEFRYLHSFIKLRKDSAIVDLILIIDLPEANRDSLLLEAYLPKDSLTIEVNGESFVFNSTQRKYSFPQKGRKSLYLLAHYKICTRHTFSGPPGPWMKGNVFKITAPLKTSQGRKVPRRANILVQAPQEYALKGKNNDWKIIFKGDGLALYDLMNSSSLQEEVKFLKKDKKDEQGNGK